MQTPQSLEPPWPSGPAFKRGALNSFRSDGEIVSWVHTTVSEMNGGPISPIGSRLEKHIKVALFLVASSVVGADEHRIGKLFGLDEKDVTEWAENLRRNGLWLKDGTALCEDWFDKDGGSMGFTMDSLVAEGLIQSRLDPVRGRVYETVLGRNINEDN